MPISCPYTYPTDVLGRIYLSISYKEKCHADYAILRLKWLMTSIRDKSVDTLP